MKKYLIMLSFFLAASNAFSLVESNFSVGFLYGNIFDLTENTARPTEGFTQAPGVTLTGYSFWDNKPLGLFFIMDGLFSFPKISHPDIRSYQSAILETTAGPGFRISLNDKLTFEYGVGLDVRLEGVDYTIRTENKKYTAFFFDFGIGGNASLKLDVTNAFCVVLGVNLTWTFIDGLSAAPPAQYPSGLIVSTQSWKFNSIINIKPFLGIGMNLYNTSSHYGKPPKV